MKYTSSCKKGFFSIFILFVCTQNLIAQKATHALSSKISIANKNWQVDGIFSGESPAKEILAARTEFTKKFDKGNGIVNIVFGGPFHYKDNKGGWQDINLDIKQQTNGRFAYKSDENKFIARFAQQATNGVRMEYKETSVDFGMNLSVASANLKLTRAIKSIISINQNIITYKNVFPDVDVEYETTSKAILHRMKFNSKETFSSLKSEDLINIDEEIQLPLNAILVDSLGKISTNRTTVGLIHILVNGDTAFTVLPSRIWDATYTGEIFNPTPAKDEIMPTPARITFLGGCKIKYTAQVSADWLMASNRTWPVILDPPIIPGGNGDLTYNVGYGYRFPWRTNWKQSVSQTVYKQSELNMAGKIIEIAYRQGVNNGLANSNASIKMQHSTSETFLKESFIQTNWETCLSGETLNYTTGSGTSIDCTNPNPVWKKINLEKEFDYKNNGHLLIETRFLNNTTSQGIGNCGPYSGACCIGGGWYYFEQDPKSGVNGSCDCSSKYPGEADYSLLSPVIKLTINTTPNCTTPGKPKDLNASATGQTSADLTWDAGDPEGSSKIKYHWVVGTSKDVTIGNAVDEGSTSSTSDNTSKLKCGTKYYLRVYASTSCDDSESDYTTSSSFTTPDCSSTCTPPETPKGLTTAPISSSQIKLSWQSVAGANGYDLYYCDGSYIAYTANNSYTVGNLLAGTEYSFKIKAQIDPACTSTFTTCKDAKTPSSNGCPSLQSPKELKPTAVSTSEINLTWEAVDGAIGYDLYYCDGTYIAYTTNTSYLKGNLKAGTNYKFKVAAQAGQACISKMSSCEEGKTLINNECTPPQTPKEFKATGISSSEIKLTWESVPGATGYDIHFCDGTFVGYTESTNYVKDGLTENLKYSFKIDAQIGNKDCVSKMSDCEDAKTFKNNNCIPPTEPISISATQLIISEGQSTVLKAVGGSLNSASDWNWTQGSFCSGATIGLGSTLSVSPKITTTYSVSASACGIVSPCKSITVTVNQANNILSGCPTGCNPNKDGKGFNINLQIIADSKLKYTSMTYNILQYGSNIPRSTNFNWRGVPFAKTYELYLSDANGKTIYTYPYISPSTLLIANMNDNGSQQYNFQIPSDAYLSYSTNYLVKITAKDASGNTIACSLNPFKVMDFPIPRNQPKTYDQILGNHKNILLFNNVIYISNICQTGNTDSKWTERDHQCTDYVRRFYKNIFNYDTKNSGLRGQFAKGYRDFILSTTTTTSKGLKFIYNGNSLGKTPKPGDIICYGPEKVTNDRGQRSHVSIVNEITSTEVKVMQQNTCPTNAYNNGLTYTGTTITEDKVQGWITPRLPNQIKTGNPSYFLSTSYSSTTIVKTNFPFFTWMPSQGATFDIYIKKLSGDCYLTMSEYNPMKSLNPYIQLKNLSNGQYLIQVFTNLPNSIGRLEGDYHYFKITGGAAIYGIAPEFLSNEIKLYGSKVSNSDVYYKNNSIWDLIGKTNGNGSILNNPEEDFSPLDSVAIMASGYEVLKFRINNFDVGNGKYHVPLFKKSNLKLEGVVNPSINYVSDDITNNPIAVIKIKAENFTGFRVVKLIAEETYGYDHYSTDDSLVSIRLDTGVNNVHVEFYNQVDTVNLFKSIFYFPGTLYDIYSRYINIPIPTEMIGGELFINDELKGPIEKSSTVMRVLKYDNTVTMSRFGFKDYKLSIDSNGLIYKSIEIPLERNYLEIGDSININLGSADSLGYSWGISVKKINTDALAESLYLKRHKMNAASALIPKSELFSYIKQKSSRTFLKTQIILNQKQILTKDSIYLLNIIDGKKYKKIDLKTSLTAHYDSIQQKLTYTDIRFDNGLGMREELVLLKNQAPIMKSPAIIDLHSGETLPFPISYFVSDPDSIKNDVTISSTDVKIRVEGNIVYVTAPVGFIGNATFSLTATHDFLDASKRFSMKVMPPRAYVPTGFTPNKDGKNDILRPTFMGKLANCHFTLFSRFGQKVFETTDCTSGWDGKIGGIEQQTGVFVWMLSYQFEGEGKKEEKGTVTIIR